ncbi:hypothetical protein GTS_38390 [Gandjariella thermophila]|uniref:Uncharacterized protein n=1 Tax=Gandjariella thermophila TaxID=1931992 RepID=A0A4D4JCN8_9PSEU|nr:hypothetical protein GTS_38390 [Gandjariella thermophila]
MTMRLSASSFAGTARTLVAVGTVSDCCMFLAIAAAAPRSGLRSSPGVGRTGALAAAAEGDGLPVLGSVGVPAGLAGAAVPAVSLGARPLAPRSVPGAGWLGLLGAGVLGAGALADGRLDVDVPPAGVSVVVRVVLVVVLVPPAWLAAAPPFPLDRCVGL